MRVLGIESSCDETAAAVVDIDEKNIKVISNIVSSQMGVHKQYGGVVPEVAARKHLQVLLPLLDRAIGLKQLSQVDLLAVTAGPGLITSLMVGTETAKALAYALAKPLIGINHLEAHIYANWLTYPELFQRDKTIFPSLALIVSGGHTELVLMRGHGKYSLIGQTLDDAAGEAFDKVARILQLGYPGGPIVARLASQGNPAAIDFPRPMIDKANFDFSFAGLKTAVLYHVQSSKLKGQSSKKDICVSFQLAVCDVLIKKTAKAAMKYSAKSLMLVGGVSANQALRDRFTVLGEQLDLPVYFPQLELTGDNAAMIAVAAYYHRRDKGLKDNWKKLRFDPQLRAVGAIHESPVRNDNRPRPVIR